MTQTALSPSFPQASRAAPICSRSKTPSRRRRRSSRPLSARLAQPAPLVLPDPQDRKAQPEQLARKDRGEPPAHREPLGQREQPAPPAPPVHRERRAMPAQ